MAVQIQLRGDTAANWTSANPTLAAREIGVETDTTKLKIGDGSSDWASLPYLPAQPIDATLTAFAALTIAANSLTIGTGADAFSQTTFGANTFPARASSGNLVAKTITDFGLSLVDDADASAARTTLGLGSLATQSGTFSGTSSGTNTGDQSLPVKASGAELDTGTDDAKFATAKAIKDSHNVPSVAPGTSGNVLTSNGTDWTSAAPSGGGGGGMTIGDAVSGADANRLLFVDGDGNLADADGLKAYPGVLLINEPAYEATLSARGDDSTDAFSAEMTTVSGRMIRAYEEGGKAHVVIGDVDAAGNRTGIDVYDAGNACYLRAPYGTFAMGDPDAINTGVSLLVSSSEDYGIGISIFGQTYAYGDVVVTDSSQGLTQADRSNGHYYRFKTTLGVVGTDDLGTTPP